MMNWECCWYYIVPSHLVLSSQKNIATTGEVCCHLIKPMWILYYNHSNSGCQHTFYFTLCSNPRFVICLSFLLCFLVVLALVSWCQTLLLPHRLYWDTSGLLTFGITGDAHRNIFQQFFAWCLHSCSKTESPLQQLLAQQLLAARVTYKKPRWRKK